MNEMKKIIVFGASGGTGKQVVHEALNAGYEVTVIVRNTEDYIFGHPLLEIIQGDVFEPETFKSAMVGKDAVVSCLGYHKREPTTVYSEGITNIMKAMQAGGVKRLICLSNGAIEIPQDESYLIKFKIKNILQRIFKYSIADMLLMENILKDSGLNWTVIRPSRLLNSLKTGKYRVSINRNIAKPSSVSRKDLAEYIFHHLFDEKIYKSKVEISY
jgi:putative NADH-flavin reductase